MKTEQWKLLEDDEPIPDYAVMSRGGRWIKLQVRKMEYLWEGDHNDYLKGTGTTKEVMTEWQDVTWEEE